MFKRIRTAAVLASALIASAGCDGRGGGSPTGLPPSSWEAAIATAEGLEVTRFGLGGQTAELSNGEDESQRKAAAMSVTLPAGSPIDVELEVVVPDEMTQDAGPKESRVPYERDLEWFFDVDFQLVFVTNPPGQSDPVAASYQLSPEPDFEASAEGRRVVTCSGTLKTPTVAGDYLVRMYSMRDLPGRRTRVGETPPQIYTTYVRVVE